MYKDSNLNADSISPLFTFHFFGDGVTFKSLLFSVLQSNRTIVHSSFKYCCSS